MQEKKQYRIFTSDSDDFHFSGGFQDFGKHKFGKHKFGKCKSGNMNCCQTIDFGGVADKHHVHQIIKDGSLVILLMVPGLAKDSIKLRAKATKLTLTGRHREDLIEFLGEEEFKQIIKLQETVEPNSAQADYKDGIMKISFPIVETGEEISFNSD